MCSGGGEHTRNATDREEASVGKARGSASVAFSSVLFRTSINAMQPIPASSTSRSSLKISEITSIETEQKFD